MNDSESDIFSNVTSLADLTSLPDMDMFCMQLIKDSETAVHQSGAALLLKALIHYCIKKKLYSFSQLAVVIDSDAESITNLLWTDPDIFEFCNFAGDVYTIEKHLHIIKVNLKRSHFFKDYLWFNGGKYRMSRSMEHLP